MSSRITNSAILPPARDCVIGLFYCLQIHRNALHVWNANMYRLIKCISLKDGSIVLVGFWKSSVCVCVCVLFSCVFLNTFPSPQGQVCTPSWYFSISKSVFINLDFAMDSTSMHILRSNLCVEKLLETKPLKSYNSFHGFALTANYPIFICPKYLPDVRLWRGGKSH